MDIFSQMEGDVELVINKIINHVEENIAFEKNVIEAAQLFVEFEQQQQQQDEQIDIDDSLINNVENVCLENNLDFINNDTNTSKPIEIDYEEYPDQLQETTLNEPIKAMPLKDVTNIINYNDNKNVKNTSTTISKTKLNDTNSKKKNLTNDINDLNREIRYETRTKLKRKRDIKDTGGSTSNQDIYDNEAEDDENDENQPPQQPSTSASASSKPAVKKQQSSKSKKPLEKKQESVKKLKSKKESVHESQIQSEQAQQTQNNEQLIDKENEIIVFLANQMGQRELTIQTNLPASPEFRHQHHHLGTVSDMIARNPATGESEQKMRKPVPIDEKYLQPLTLQMTCEEDNYDINNINRMLASNNDNKSTLVTFAVTDPAQNQYMRINDFATLIHNQQHNYLHSIQSSQAPVKTYIQTPVLYDELNCLSRKTTKRKLSDMETNETFKDELGFTIQYSKEPPKNVTFDLNNNNQNAININNNNNNIKVEQPINQQHHHHHHQQQQQHLDEDDGQSLNDSVEEDSEFKTSYIIDGQDLLDIDRDKSPDSISIQSFSLKIIKILFTKEELVNGIIIGEDGKNRSKFKFPLDQDRLDIVKDVIRHKYRMQPHEVEANWNAIRSKLNARIGAIKK